MRAQVCSKGKVEVLQFKATVWPKVASESTYEAQNFQKFLGGGIPQTPLISSTYHTASSLKLGGAWVEVIHKCSVSTQCPGIDCVLATPLERGVGGESGGAGGEEEAGQKEEARVRLSKYKPVESHIVSWRVLGMSTLQSMLHTTVST